MPHRSAEGNDEQRRAKAREARAEGNKPSELGETLGASKQTKHASHAKGSESHQERLDQRHQGKEAKTAKGSSGKPRPGNRDTDPKRTNRWG
jgi:hypothetical protein